ncbi:D-alanyl-D-alanine carboxypeptidase [Streptomyces camponoticapitis]|uniref:D-alanyl-D-alanine carboxypeptidase n=1 Tax=Streptomyces camponoticapitis TaxID=1616125 RepID=A0ABQ2EGJ5_9ACTN|nr:hypothetical protein [Streptomyces camponoticapitis]GGK11734.1 D-alanyl-D-alanine carboxypeptidase [Streptomyces camponoticapitis]
MAGESPDKSEQRKSSGEATHEQDPRFAVFRESDATAGEAEGGADTAKDAAPGTDGSAADTPEPAGDRATAVFTVRGESGRSEAPEAAGARVTAPEGPSTRGPSEPEADVAEAKPETRGGETPAAPEEAEADADRRTAVFRAPEAEPGAAAERKSGPDAGPAAPRPGVSKTVEPEPESPGGAKSGAAPATSGPDAEERAVPAPDTAADKPEARRGAAPASKSDGASVTAEPEAEKRGDSASAEPGTGGGAKPGDASSAPKTPSVPAGESKSDIEKRRGAASDAPEATLEAGADAADGKRGTGGAARAGGAAAVSAGGSKSDAAPAASGPEAEKRRGAASDAPEATLGAGADAADSKPGTGGPAGPAPYPTAAKSAAASPEPKSGAPAAAAAKAEAAEKQAHGAAKPAAPPAEPEAGSAGVGAGGGDDGPGVDRKTAVFKTVTRPAVDQPTAMLKLPPQPPAEPPAERTSKFVPLRADDVRAPAQPVGAPSGQAVAEAERTRQQPMPPLPPLDLLAELTNKPAPPETPTRTVVRRVKIWTPLLVLVLIIFAVVQAVRPLPAPSLNLTAKSTFTFEGDKPALPWPGEGQGFMAATGLGTVDSFGEQKAVPIGSVAKAMTAYVVLQDHPLKKGAKGPSIKVDAKAEEDGGLDAQGESTLNTVKEGDTLTQHDALAALMIPSANNIARLLARWDANGSEEAFVKKMNDTAADLGMKNTKYTDPSGLDATTVSSAEDQVKLGQKLVEIEALMDITKLPEWTDPSGKSWRNYNTLVPYDGALGIKTGSTTKAGGNLLFAAHQMVGDTDQLIVGAVLGQHKSPIIDTVNAVSKDVMLATQDELEGATIVKKGAVVGEVDNGMGGTTPVVATEDVKAVGWSGLTVKLELTDGGKTPPHAAAAGTHVGTLTVGEGKSQVEVAVALQSDVSEPSFTDKLTRVG